MWKNNKIPLQGRDRGHINKISTVLGQNSNYASTWERVKKTKEGQ